ncbi:hypothetical protein C0995_009199 [Termitomyces sp. Mi166|nr:hypothetical protein C0995_009199 [Termitomyces sp. Mi166\
MQWYHVKKEMLAVSGKLLDFVDVSPPVEFWQAAGLPATAAFLQDDLAIMVVEGLLDQIKLMRRQHISMLEQIERVGKRKAPVFEEPMVEPKQARAPSQRP